MNTNDGTSTQLNELEMIRVIYGSKLIDFKQGNDCINGTLYAICQLNPDQVIRLSTKTFTRTKSKPVKVKLDIVFSNYYLKYLPPIKVEFVLPPEYPMCSPSFSILASWLNFSQISLLCKKLESIWFENYNTGVLYYWMEFLKHDTFEFLQIKFPYTINLETPKNSHDIRAVQEVMKSSLLHDTLHNFNEEMLAEEFKNSSHFCNICIKSILGSACIEIKSCLHVFCKMCMEKYVSTCVDERKILKIQCPNTLCTAILSNSTIKSVLAPSVYTCYDELLFKQALQSMSDIVYCPRKYCSSIAEIQYSDKSMAICMICKYCFCPKCQRTYHGLNACTFRLSEMRDLMERYSSADAELKHSLEFKYGKSVLEQIKMDVSNQEWLEKNSKPCPCCKFPIERALGCNKILCTNCETHFCWLCLKILSNGNPYKHYTEGEECHNKLFEGINEEELLHLWQ